MGTEAPPPKGIKRAVKAWLPPGEFPGGLSTLSPTSQIPDPTPCRFGFLNPPPPPPKGIKRAVKVWLPPGEFPGGLAQRMRGGVGVGAGPTVPLETLKREMRYHISPGRVFMINTRAQ